MKTTPRLLAVLAVAVIAAAGDAPAPPTDVTYIDSARVASAFAKGMPLLENTQFKIHAGRREAPGIPEVHTRDTDVIHVLEGSATFVTGGTTVEPKSIGPDEIRGKSIAGGQSRRIRKGDVIIVPSGVPHWFKEVEGPVLYFVVKVTR